MPQIFRRRIIAVLLVASAVANAALAQSPADLPPERFAQLPKMSQPRLSPDGNHIAYFHPIDGRRYLVIQELFSPDTPTVIPTMSRLEFRWVEWANNERLVFSMSYADRRWLTETTETRLLSVDLSGDDVVQLVKPARVSEVGTRVATRELPPAQVQDNVIDWLPDDPHHILVALDEDQDARFEVRKIDIRSGEYDVARSGMRGIQNWLVDRQHEVRVGYGYDFADRTIMVSDTAGKWRTATSQGWWEQGYRLVAFTDDPAVVYADGPNDAGIDVLRLLNIETGELGEVVFEHEDVDTSGFVIDRYSGRLTGVSYIDDFEREHYLDRELVSLQASVDHVFSQTVNQLVSWSADRRRVLVHVYSDVEPGAYYFWDRDAKSMDLVSATYEDLPPELLSPVQAVTYKARDGLTIPAYLTVPRGVQASALATVVLPHGGPQARSDRGFWYLAQFLASRGYAVLQPNFRGSTGYGAAFEAAGRGEWGGKMQDDVTDGARWLIEQGIADPARLCIAGWSYGGYAAAMGAVKTPDLYRCAASINGVLNLPRLIADDKEYIGGRIWTQHMGLTDEKSTSVSPRHQADRIKVPMLIIQATDDTRVHEDQGKGMYRELQDLGKPVEYVEIELGGHGMDNESARLTVLRSLDEFLGKHIGNAASD